MPDRTSGTTSSTSSTIVRSGRTTSMVLGPVYSAARLMPGWLTGPGVTRPSARAVRSTYGFAAADFTTTWFAFAQLASTKIWASLPFASALSNWAVYPSAPAIDWLRTT
jgi:hypothetical protein